MTMNDRRKTLIIEARENDIFSDVMNHIQFIIDEHYAAVYVTPEGNISLEINGLMVLSLSFSSLARENNKNPATMISIDADELIASKMKDDPNIIERAEFLHQFKLPMSSMSELTKNLISTLECEIWNIFSKMNTPVYLVDSISLNDATKKSFNEYIRVFHEYLKDGIPRDELIKDESEAILKDIGFHGLVFNETQDTPNNYILTVSDIRKPDAVIASVNSIKERDHVLKIQGYKKSELKDFPFIFIEQLQEMKILEDKPVILKHDTEQITQHALHFLGNNQALFDYLIIQSQIQTYIQRSCEKYHSMSA